MSRIGKRNIQIPAGTEVVVSATEITVKGKGGTLKRPLHSSIAVKVDGNEVSVAPSEKTRLARALWGTYAAHLRNMIKGVNEPFKKSMQIEGVGYKAEMQGKNIKFALGFSHPVIMAIPDGLTTVIEKNIIHISGADKDMVGQFGANLRALKKPEPYKGKGIRYVGEVIKLKAGKKATGASS